MHFRCFGASLVMFSVAAAQVGTTPAAIPVTITKSQHSRLMLPEDIQRIAVGDSDVLSAEPMSNRELLVLGKGSGRTTLIVWFRNGDIREYIYTVQRDLSILQAALRKIHPAIEVEIAPDREAIVLTGVVPDITYSQAAESVARNYLEAGAAQQQTGAARPLIAAPAPAQTGTEPAPNSAAPAQPAPAPNPPTAETVRVPALLPPSGRVINLLRLEKLPMLAEAKILEAIQGIGGGNVSVRRIIRGPIRDDSKDALVLEGSVLNQVALVRILTVASQIFAGQAIGAEDIRVVADEAGFLASRAQET